MGSSPLVGTQPNWVLWDTLNPKGQELIGSLGVFGKLES